MCKTRAWFLVLALAAMMARAMAAGPPFSVDTEPAGDGYDIVASNWGLAPISARVALAVAQDARSDPPAPFLVTLPALSGRTVVGRVAGTAPGGLYSFQLQVAYTEGDYRAVHSPDAIYRLPYPDGQTYQISQAPGGPITTHTGIEAAYAVDITMPEGALVVAARSGRVIKTKADATGGGASPAFLNQANEVQILHADGTIGSYAHFAPGGVLVQPGQSVAAGAAIGRAGATGYAVGPHLHFGVLVPRATPAGFTLTSLPFRFYVGNPPVVFSPTYRMLARAEYRLPATRPSLDERAAMLFAPNSVTAIAATQTPPRYGFLWWGLALLLVVSVAWWMRR